MRPTKIRLETTTYCQLRCPSCPTTTGAINKAVGKGWLRLADFEKLITENPWLKEIELSNYGEMFLNPELGGILECAHRHGVELTADNGVNLNTADEGTLESLVKFRFKKMRVSIDGASQETYGIYRRRGNFETVISNVRRINHFKKHHGSEFPRLAWQFIVYGHNEHELPRAREMAAELGMEFAAKLSWDSGFSPVVDAEFVRREGGLPASTREEFLENRGEDYMHGLCRQLWEQPQVNWDGKLLGCCRNFWGDFGGNVFRDGLMPSLNNEKMNHARAMLQGHKPARADIPCTTCQIYLTMRGNNRWLEMPEGVAGASG